MAHQIVRIVLARTLTPGIELRAEVLRRLPGQRREALTDPNASGTMAGHALGNVAFPFTTKGKAWSYTFRLFRPTDAGENRRRPGFEHGRHGIHPIIAQGRSNRLPDRIASGT